MSGTTVAAYESLSSPFLDIGFRSFAVKSECNGSYSIGSAESRKVSDSDDFISNGTTDSFCLKTDHIFDEEVEITDIEEVKTPRVSSPTISELKKRLATVSGHKSIENPVIPDGSKHNGHIPKRMLSEVTSKPCPYPIDRLYDECIPVKSRIRSFKGKLGFTSEGHFGDNISRMTPRSVSSQNSLRILEDMPTCSLPGQLLRQTYSSSGSLIANLTDLSLNNNALLSIPLSSGFHFSKALFGFDIPLNSDSVEQTADLPPIFTEESLHFSDKPICELTLPDFSCKQDVVNPAFSKLQNGNVNTMRLESEEYLHENGHTYAQSFGLSSVRDKSHSRGKRSGSKKTVVKENGDTVHNDSNEAEEQNLVNSDCFSDCVSEMGHHPSLKNTKEEEETNRGALFSDQSDNNLTTPVTNISTRSNPSFIRKSSSCFPVSYIVEETNDVDEDFTLVTNRRLRRKQQQQSKLVHENSCASEKLINNHDFNSRSSIRSQPVNNTSSTSQQIHFTNRFSVNMPKHSVRYNTCLNGKEKAQSVSTHTTNCLTGARDILCRKSSYTNHSSSCFLTNSNRPKSVSNAHLHSAGHNLPSKHECINPSPTRSLQHSQVMKRPASSSVSVAHSSNIGVPLSTSTKEGIDSNQYLVLRQFLLSTWKSFVKHSTNPQI
ncbi:unnamed protein product [Heterobilharzia americana]|nr:unnamed protein product [Heterobilharzia americana]